MSTDDLNPESYGKVPSWLANLPDLGNGSGAIRRGAIALWSVLWSYRRKANGYRVWPSQELLARLLGCTTRSVSSFTAELVRVGAMTVTEVPLVNGFTRGKRNEYELRPEPPFGALSIGAQWRLDHSGRTGSPVPVLSSTSEGEDRKHSSGPGVRTGSPAQGGPEKSSTEDRKRASAEVLVLEVLELENSSFQTVTTAGGEAAPVDNRNEMSETNHQPEEPEGAADAALIASAGIGIWSPPVVPRDRPEQSQQRPEGMPSVAVLRGHVHQWEQRLIAAEMAVDDARTYNNAAAISYYEAEVAEATEKVHRWRQVLANQCQEVPA